jgi:Protein of unknown function (DUF3071)
VKSVQSLEEAAMRALRVVGLGEDGKIVILESDRGDRFQVPADERLRAAARGDITRLGQIAIELESQMRPREIQSRIRAGESVEQVAAAAGVPPEKVERFAYPVLLERSRTAELAQRAHPVREDGPDIQELGEVVSQAFTARGQDYTAAIWDSWKGEDGKWVVQLTWTAGRSNNHAHWSFHPGAHGGTVTPLDDHALDLLDPNPNRQLRTVRPVTELAAQALAVAEPRRQAVNGGEPPRRVEEQDYVQDFELTDDGPEQQELPVEDPYGPRYSRPPEPYRPIPERYYQDESPRYRPEPRYEQEPRYREPEDDRYRPEPRYREEPRGYGRADQDRYRTEQDPYHTEPPRRDRRARAEDDNERTDRIEPVKTPDRAALDERDRTARAERDRVRQAEREREERATQAERARAERERAAQAERDQAAQAERERAAQAERDQAARVERERAAQAERDQAARAERERAAQAERDRIAQAERDQAAQAERDRAAQADRERAAQAERDRVAQAERDKAERATRKPADHQTAHRTGKDNTPTEGRREADDAAVDNPATRTSPPSPPASEPARPRATRPTTPAIPEEPAAPAPAPAAASTASPAASPAAPAAEEEPGQQAIPGTMPTTEESQEPAAKTDPTPPPAPTPPARKGKGRKARPSVPSWEDVLLGTRSNR